MLTRAQAKTKECPLRAAGFWANPNDCISPSEGALNLEHAMSSFWIQNGISFPWSFNLYLYCCNGAGVHCYGNANRKLWMRQRHGEAADSLRAATRAAFMQEGR